MREILEGEVSKPAVQAQEFSSEQIVNLSRLYERILIVLLMLIPTLAGFYINFFQDSFLLYVDHSFHEVAIGIAVLQSSFISYVTWRCYSSSGEPLLRWMTLSFVGFTLIYSLHGILTPLSNEHIGLFLLYGPASRLAMAACLLAGLLTYGSPYHPLPERSQSKFWLGGVASFLGVDVLVAWIALAQPVPIQTVRLALEGTALALILAGVGYILFRRIQSWMMMVYMISLAYLAQSSLLFILAKPWNHLWWLAHLISAAGFTVLSYGVIRAFHTTRALSLVFSQEEVMKQLAAAKVASERNAQHFKNILDNLNSYVALLDVNGVIQEINKAALDISGYKREDIVGQYFYEAPWWSYDMNVQSQIIASVEAAMQGRKQRYDLVIKVKDIPVTIDFQISPIRNEQGRIVSLLPSGMDITERKKAEEALRIAAVAFETNDAIMITDVNASIMRVNRAFEKLTGYSAEEVIGKNPRILKSGRHGRDFYENMWESLTREGVWTGEIWDRDKNGNLYPKQSTITAVKDDLGNVTQYVSIFTDITARKKAEEQAHNLAFYDVLTGLPNRRLLLDKLRLALSVSGRSKLFGGLMFLDLDRFKTLNDTMGHDFGDMLLVEVANRLKLCVREVDTVARLGGDEFVVLIENISAEGEMASQHVAQVAEKIRAALSSPYLLKGNSYHSSPSIGVSLFNSTNDSVDDLIKHADLAMYQAKDAGRNIVRFFDTNMQKSVEARAEMESDLRRAISAREFRLFYQIQLDSDDHPIGVEALIRWQHSKRGLVSPAQFIPVAEESSLILEIGSWVLDTACQQIALWSLDEKMRNLVLAINISAQQFKQVDFVDQVAVMIRKYGIDSSRLKLELTESIALDDIDSVVAKMLVLKHQRGVTLSLDDFGTGYSSLSYLKRLPLDQIKIDQSFVRDIPTDPSDAVMAKTIIDMAKNFGLNVIAEGVETEAQMAFLKENGCMAFQGYLFSKPVPIEEFEALMGNRGKG